MSDKVASQFKIGEKDEAGNILVKKQWPVHLWKTPKGWFVINLWINEDEAEFLWTLRKEQDDAENLFEATLDMLK